MKKSIVAVEILFCALGLFGQSEISVSGLQCWPLKDHAEIRKTDSGKTELHLLKGSLIREKLLDVQPFFAYDGILKPGEYSLEVEVLCTKDAKMQLRVQKNVRPWDNYAKLSVWKLKAGQPKKITTVFYVEKEENGHFRIPGFRFANVEKGARITFSTPVVRKVR